MDSPSAPEDQSHPDEPPGRSLRIDSWERILEQLELIRTASAEARRVELLLELLVNLRLLGQDPCIPDRRDAKGDIEKIHAGVQQALRRTFDALDSPSSLLVYYAREAIKKLPVRHGGEEIIDRIRADAEYFEEDRAEDDPMRGFAGDMRKEVHRRLSPRIIGAFLEPYLALARDGDPGPIARAGYVALPSRFDPEEESAEYVQIAEGLLERLRYLWDYEKGDLAQVRRELADSLELFERCFLRAEVEGLIELLDPARLGQPHAALDLLKRLATLKRVLKESHAEGRIGFYDLLILDLSLGNVVFLLATDLTNNHYSTITPRNLREAMAIVGELLNISTVKGFSFSHIEGFRAELQELRDAAGLDYPRAKRCLGGICLELQRYLQAEVIDKISAVLNRVLGDYEVPTSRLSPIKTRFFNNFIRRTQIHVLSEFVEKVAEAVDRELVRRSDDHRLRAGGLVRAGAIPPAPEESVAATWREPEPRLRPYLGGKGNGIIDMASLGLRVPEAFVLGYAFFSDSAESTRLDEPRRGLVLGMLDELEGRCGRRLGDPERPLLLSVRSGAPVSMPGVMSTILNVGLTPRVRAALAARHGAALPELWYRRFLDNCAAAMAVAPRWSSRAGAAARDEGAGARGQVPLQALEGLVVEAFGEDFLLDPSTQLLCCVSLVRATQYAGAVERFKAAFPGDVIAETAVTVQRMVFGNLDDRSLSGVVLTRNPITGEDELFGDFKRQAQGEEVVMGSDGTLPIGGLDPGTKAGLLSCKDLLTAHFLQDLDLEFTVESGALFLLQARSARLGPFAQLSADTDFLARGLLDLESYRGRIERLEAAHARIALPRADFRSRRWNPPLSVGVPIYGGVVTGTLVLSEERLREAELRRESAVFLAVSTKPTDFAVMNGAQAIVTVYSGRTSHAAITAMSMNKTCIVGCADMEIDKEARTVRFRSSFGAVMREGESITADGNTGALYRGVAPISESFLPLSAVGGIAQQAETAEAAASEIRSLIRDRMTSLGRETSLRRRSLDDLPPLPGRRILLRVDANVEVAEGRVLEPGRILQLASTLRAILDRGETPIVCSHLGDPGVLRDSRLSREEIYDRFSLRPVAELLREALGGRVHFLEASVGASGLLVGRSDIVPGKVNILENLRFATGEKDNDEAFARSLAELGDGVFVNDSFNVCQRRHASITGLARFMDRCLAGPHVARELAALETLLGEPARPFVAVFGGQDLAAQFGVMAALLPRLDLLVVGAGPEAPSASPKGAPPPEGGLLREPQGSERPGADSLEALLASLRAAAPDRVLVDTERGPAGNAEPPPELARAGTIFWSGPASCLLAEGPAGGLSPKERALVEAVARGALVVVCSERERGSAASAGNLHISGGPRAFQVYLERLSLPGITVLDPAEGGEAPGLPPPRPV